MDPDSTICRVSHKVSNIKKLTIPNRSYLILNFSLSKAR